MWEKVGPLGVQYEPLGIDFRLLTVSLGPLGVNVMHLRADFPLRYQKFIFSPKIRKFAFSTKIYPFLIRNTFLLNKFKINFFGSKRQNSSLKASFR